MHPNKIMYPFSYPNPFNPFTNITFSINEKSPVQIHIHNISGEKIKEFDLGIIDQGKHTKTWHSKNKNGTQVPSGVYFFVVKTKNKKESGKMILLK